MSFVGKTQNDLEKLNVKGKVKSIKTTKSFAVTDSLGKDIFIPENVSFSSYDKKGNLIKEEIDKIVPNVRTITIIDYKYNSNDQLIEKSENDSSYYYKIEHNIPGYKFAFRYDENWSEVEYQKTVFTYNNNNQLIIKYNYPENILRDSTLFEYDDNNKLIKETTYYLNSNGNWYTIYEYDKNNNLIEKKSGDKNRLHNKNIYKYDLKGRIIEDSACYYHERIISHLNIFSNIRYTYNNFNDVTESKETSNMGLNTNTNIYNYNNIDTYGNWTEKEELFDNSPYQSIKFFIKREIEYYD
jgi:hypothetical protein